jgi:nucleotide-binding universal stress UspA family protein
VSNDPTTDVDDTLLRTIEETGAELVIMASHKPDLADYFWPSNGGKIASHSDASVFIVRDA